MDCSTADLPVHHQPLEFTQTQFHWVGDAIQPSSSSVVPFFSCLKSFSASESFPVSQLFTSDGQSIGVSASASVLPMYTQNWSPLGWTGWISLQSKVKVKSLSCVRLFATPWTITYQAPPSMGFSRQEYWSGLPFPSPGDLPDPGIDPRSPALQANALTSEPPGKPHPIFKALPLILWK